MEIGIAIVTINMKRPTFTSEVLLLHGYSICYGISYNQFCLFSQETIAGIEVIGVTSQQACDHASRVPVRDVPNPVLSAHIAYVPL